MSAFRTFPGCKVLVEGQTGFVTDVRVPRGEELSALLLTDDTILQAHGQQEGELVLVYLPKTRGSTIPVDPSLLTLHPDEVRLRAIEVACGLRAAE